MSKDTNLLDSWHHIASLRENTYNWKLEVPKIEKIKGILDDLHIYSPSKQRVVRYHIEVYRNDDEENKKKIYRAHVASLRENSRHNPQVLAPWLLFFRPRFFDSGVETDSNKKTKKDNPQMWVDFYMDVGIATSHIIYSATSRGLDTGLCRCVIFKDLIIDIIGYEPELVIGIGYKNNNKFYKCLHYNKMVKIPDSNFDQKPDMNEYIRFI